MSTALEVMMELAPDPGIGVLRASDVTLIVADRRRVDGVSGLSSCIVSCAWMAARSCDL
jgi:hypothetical protein